MTETNPCVECGSDRVEPYRKKCRKCINCWNRHGMSLADWKVAQEAKEKQRSELTRGMCRPCGKDTKYPKFVDGMLMCDACNVAYGKYQKSVWREAMNTALTYREAHAPTASLPIGAKKGSN